MYTRDLSEAQKNNYKYTKQWSFDLGRGCSRKTSSMGVGGKGTKAADLAGTQGEHTNTVVNKVSNRINQLLGLITL